MRSFCGLSFDMGPTLHDVTVCAGIRAIVYRGETVLEPMPNRVAMNPKELGDIARIIAAGLLDQVQRISPPLFDLPPLRGHAAPQARRRDTELLVNQFTALREAFRVL